jgi:hypothetical protein
MAAFWNRTVRYAAAAVEYFTDDNTSILEIGISAIAKASVTSDCKPSRQQVLPWSSPCCPQQSCPASEGNSTLPPNALPNANTNTCRYTYDRRANYRSLVTTIMDPTHRCR